MVFEDNAGALGARPQDSAHAQSTSMYSTMTSGNI